jgi:hypothetical protein
MEKLVRHQRDAPEPLERLRDDMPAGLSALIERMMAKDPADRYQTPAAVALALLPYIRAQPARPTETTKKPASTAQPRQHDTPLPMQLQGHGERARFPANRHEHSDTLCP